MMQARLATLATVATVCGGCVTEEVAPRRDEVPPLLDLPESVLPAGAYHGVTLFFEIDMKKDISGDRAVESSELPEVAEWMNAEGQLELPPIVPVIFWLMPRGVCPSSRTWGLHSPT